MWGKAIVQLPDGSYVPRHNFAELIDADECRDLIKSSVANLELEHKALEEAKLNPQPLDEATRKLFNFGKSPVFTTEDLARARVVYFERAQDRLWQWYREKTSGTSR
ncbi:hypothetical protein COSMO_24 [Mycobacterium phage Cosmo]|uniref:Endolysin domain protein n=1 Tax=Mycobacterium phage Cosmo TaxID=1567467 RepID=A0A0B5A4T6_9CAUD|nr:hypothetical protein COSMO_24 [Mycobacterium phage Cosmo]